MYTIISFVNINPLMSSLPICILLIYFGCLIDLARTSSNMVKIGAEWTALLYPLWFYFSENALSFFPFNLMLVIGLLYIAFIMFRYVPFIPDLSNTFKM